MGDVGHLPCGMIARLSKHATRADDLRRMEDETERARKRHIGECTDEAWRLLILHHFGEGAEGDGREGERWRRAYEKLEEEGKVKEDAARERIRNAYNQEAKRRHAMRTERISKPPPARKNFRKRQSNRARLLQLLNSHRAH